jgi:hypothetical protein
MKIVHLMILALPLALTACEEPSTAEKVDSGAKSTLGKAKASADRTMDKIEANQEKLSKQADDIFGNGN